MAKQFTVALPEIQQVEGWIGRKKCELVKLEHEIALAENWMRHAMIKRATNLVKQKHSRKAYRKN